MSQRNASFWAVFLFLFVAASASAQDVAPSAPATLPMRTLVVGTKPIPPFVVQNADGSFSGISIDLWKRVAEQLNIPYTIRVYEVRQLLDPDHNGIDVQRYTGSSNN